MNTDFPKDDLQFFGVCATGALCIGLLLNAFRDQPLPLSYQSKETRFETSIDRLAKAPVVHKPDTLLSEKLSLEEMSDYVSKKKGLILDARPEIFHRLGRIPGALSLPRDDFENSYHTLREMLEKDRSQPLAIYCSSASCEDAEMVRKALARLGHTQLSVFEGGWTQWTQAGKAEERE